MTVKFQLMTVRFWISRYKTMMIKTLWVIFPGGIVRALGRMASEYYGSLAKHGSSEPFRSRMLDFAGLNDLVGTPELLALGKGYEG